MGESESGKARVGQNAVIEGSTLQGAFIINSRAKVKSTTLQGPIEIREGIEVTSCMLSASQPTVISSAMSNEMKMFPTAK